MPTNQLSPDLADDVVRNRDRMLPSQPFLRRFFDGDDGSFYRQLENVTTSVLPVKSIHDKWDVHLKPEFSYEALGSDLAALHHLQLLVRLLQCRQVLEVGTYVGVSSLFLAEAVGPEGSVTTVEVGAEFAKIAQENFRRNGLAQRIELINADVFAALPMLQQREKRYGLIFLDADKEHYGNLLAPLLALLQDGGLLIVDDIFLQGDVLNAPPTTGKGRGVKDLLDKVAALSDHPKVVLPYGNGQLLIMKPA